MTDKKEDSALHFGKLNSVGFEGGTLEQQVLARIGRDRSNEPVNIFEIQANPNGYDSKPTSGYDFEGKDYTLPASRFDKEGYDPEPFDGFDHAGKDS